jgi:serine/threonine protein kinase
MRLDHWAARQRAGRDAIVSLARFLRHMHDQGVAHIDLSPRNILIRTGAGGLEFFLLDYEDVRFAAHLSRRRRLDNLNHLHERTVRLISLRDRLRFLREYAGPDYEAWRDDLSRMIRRSRSKHVQGLWEH